MHPSMIPLATARATAWAIPHRTERGASGCSVLLVLWPSRDVVRARYRGFKRSRWPCRVVAYFEPGPLRAKGRRSRFIGTIHVSREDLEVDTLAHECVHAAKHFQTIVGRENEEDLAYGTDSLLKRSIECLRARRIRVKL